MLHLYVYSFTTKFTLGCVGVEAYSREQADEAAQKFVADDSYGEDRLTLLYCKALKTNGAQSNTPFFVTVDAHEGSLRSSGNYETMRGSNG